MNKMRRTILITGLIVGLIPYFPTPVWAQDNSKESVSSLKKKLVYWHAPAAGKRVALTFDDGPNPNYTPRILDILKEYNVKATFFVTGRQVDKYPEIARRIVEEGHVIGNHGANHHEMKIYSRRNIQSEIKSCQESIYNATGVNTALFRPPYGMFNGNVIREMKATNHSLIQWSVSPRDWSLPKPEKIIRRVAAKAKDGSIILMHDSHPFYEKKSRQPTIDALPGVIETLKRQGFELVTVSELLGLEHSQLAAAETIQIAARETNAAN